MLNLLQPGHSHSCENELVKSLLQVLSDDSFKVKTTSTIEAKRCAEALLKWCLNSENAGLLNDFTKNLIESLGNQRSIKKIWTGFFLLRLKSKFINQWTSFLKAAGVLVKPVLFQHLTDKKTAL